MLLFVEGFVLSALVGGLALAIMARIAWEALRAFLGMR